MKIKFFVLMVVMILVFYCTSGYSEELENTLYVTANQLNGRITPSKNGILEVQFDKGFDLEPTGNWSKNREWIEVYGGESGTVWVNVRYVSEIMEPIYISTNYDKVKIRNKPVEGKVTGYLKKGKDIEISQIVLGWGKCKSGWIDMSYCDWGE